MAHDKNVLGRSIPPQERETVDQIAASLFSRGQVRAIGAESSELENDAAENGAALLFQANKEGCISALSIMLIPKEAKRSRRIAAVAQAFGFVCKINSKERIAVITPKGYVTDFASIPWFGHWLISPFGKHAEAAVVHDWLYTLGTPGDRKGRRTADKAFLNALKLLDVGFFRRHIMYWAVRLGGAGGYGLVDDFVFRDFPDLTITDPLPDKNPLLATFATDKITKESRRATQDTFVAKSDTPAGH